MLSFVATSARTLLLAIGLLSGIQAQASLFGIGQEVNGLPAIVLEAEYSYYGETGTLSKLKGRHLRPPYSLPVSSVAIVDHLNAEMDKRKLKIAPHITVTDRLQWGEFEIFSVLKPLPNGKQISKPTPVICKSKYDCRVDGEFEYRLSKDQRALLGWVRYYLLKHHSARRLNNQQSARITRDYKLFSIFNKRSVSTPAINFWLNMPRIRHADSISLTPESAPERSGRPAINAITDFVWALQALPADELNEQSFAFNQIMGDKLQSLFAGQYSYPYTRISQSDAGHVRYSREDLSALELADELRKWRTLTPLAYIKGISVRYLVISVNDNSNDLHVIPVSCKSTLCSQLNWEQLRSTETRLLNHPEILAQFSRFFTGF